jgi:hypothetical protein
LVLIVTVHGVLVSGVQFEDQPAKVPELVVAESVTVEPAGKNAVHPAPEPVQLMPGGLLVTVPVPAPTKYTLSDGSLDPPPFGSTLMLEVATMKPDTGSVTLAVTLLIQGGTPPQATAVASPVELIVAIPVSAEAQVTISVMSTVIGGAVYVPLAMNCEVSPIVYKVCVFIPGRIVIADNALCCIGVPGLTVKVAVPVMVPEIGSR